MLFWYKRYSLQLSKCQTQVFFAMQCEWVVRVSSFLLITLLFVALSIPGLSVKGCQLETYIGRCGVSLEWSWWTRSHCRFLNLSWPKLEFPHRLKSTALRRMPVHRVYKASISWSTTYRFFVLHLFSDDYCHGVLPCLTSPGLPKERRNGTLGHRKMWGITGMVLMKPISLQGLEP